MQPFEVGLGQLGVPLGDVVEAGHRRRLRGARPRGRARIAGVTQPRQTDPFGWLRRARGAARAATGLRRTPVPRPPGPGPLDLASNDYLGLARDPRVVEAAVAAARTWGAGATGSRLVTGSTDLHAELEARAGRPGRGAGRAGALVRLPGEPGARSSR